MAKTAAPADPLAPLAPETMREIAATGVVRSYPKNTIIINEGEVGDSLYIVLSGRTKVFASNAAGSEGVSVPISNAPCDENGSRACAIRLPSEPFP